MMKERKKLVFRAMACLTLMAVVLMIGPEVYAAGSFTFPVFVPYLPMADMKVFASQSLCYTACSASCASLRSNDFFQKSLPDMRVPRLFTIFIPFLI